MSELQDRIEALKQNIDALGKLGGNAGAISDVAPGKTLLGVPADDYRQTLRLWAAQKQLPDLIKQMKKK